MEDNKLIAEFIGFDEEDGIWVAADPYIDQLYQLSDLRFHISWDWLMPVVEKIEEMGFNVVIDNTDCWIFKGKGDVDHNGEYTDYVYSFSTDYDRKIKSVYESVVNFIRWYNKQLLNNE